MALSFVEYTPGSPTTGPFSYGSILTLNEDIVPVSSQLDVFVDGVLQVITTDYTINTASKEITLVSSITSGNTLRIARDTLDTSRYVDFTNGARLTESTLDLDSNQLFFLIQEATDNTLDAMVKNAGGQWEAQGVRIENGAPGTEGDHFVTVDQAYSILTGGDAAAIDDADVYRFTGNGSTTWFQLNTMGTEPQRFIVTVDSVLQSPDRTYPSADTAGVYDILVPTDGTYPGGADGVHDVLSFDSAPTNGVEIVVRSLKGTVITTVDDSAITTDKIADNAVTVDKLGFDPGASNRFILVDSAGNPTVTVVGLAQLDAPGTWIAANIGLEDLTANATVNVNSKNITGVATPTASSHAANKSYVDSKATTTLNSANAYTDSQVSGVKRIAYGSYVPSYSSGSAVNTISPGFTVGCLHYSQQITDGSTIYQFTAIFTQDETRTEDPAGSGFVATTQVSGMNTTTPDISLSNLGGGGRVHWMAVEA